MKNIFDVHSREANSFVATAFAVVVTSLMIGGYEVTQMVTHPDAVVSQAVQEGRSEQAPAVARLDTIVVRAKRG